MRNFIDSFIKTLIYILVLLIILLLGFIAYVFFTTQSNNIDIQDTISYIKSIGNKAGELVLTDKNIVNFSSVDTQNNTNNSLKNTSNVTRYYYTQLDDNSKVLYNSLENNIDNLKNDAYIINFSTKFNDLLNKSNGQEILNKSFQSALDAFFYDHPELFYIDLTKISLTIKYSTIGTRTTYSVSFSPGDNQNYLYNNYKSQAQVKESITKVENIRNNILKTIPSNSTDYEKALAVHDALVNLIEYDTTQNKDNSHNIYGALVENCVVCEGYSKAFKYILDSLDIQCILASGKATNSSGITESHMWNYIKLDDNWYGVDVTWDDPIVIGGFTKNIIRHNYFCKGTSVFNKDHILDNKISDNGKSFLPPLLSSANYKQ